ncbi:MAG TPA: AraC family transcriptional regulator ligand-binding domain-containing protein [Cytophagales bacterium]|nr:AraC family transcriptional regulator ligand-binding domain-containing protein [Cytophagales bacterium]
MNIAALHLHNNIVYAQLRGVSTAGLGLDGLPTNLTDETAHISVETFYRVLRELDGALNDPLWGIKSGEFLTLKLLGLIFRISMRVTTVGEAFHYLQSYMDAALPIIKIRTDVANNLATITLRIDHDEDEINRVILEHTLTIISREIKLMSTEAPMIHIGTPYYTELYPHEWRLDSDFTISFRPVILKAALPERGYLHLDMLIPEYLRLMEKLKNNSSFVSKVKLAMLSLSSPQLPDIQRVSDTLCLSPRTLQRRLSAEDTSFRRLSEEIKKQVCTYMLQHECYTVSSFSYVLGYSEPAALIHAFQKWFGDAPIRMREKLKAEIR